MKEYMKTNRILFILIGLAVLVSVVVVGNRWLAESGNKTYDVVLDYNELELLAEQSEEDITWWLEQFRDMGITRVGLTEESLSTLMENSPFPVSATLMDEVMQDAAWMEQYPAAFVDEITRYGYDRFDVLVEAGSTEAVDFVTDAVSKRFHREDVIMLDQGDACYILINGAVTDTLYTETQALHNQKRRLYRAAEYCLLQAAVSLPGSDAGEGGGHPVSGHGGHSPYPVLQRAQRHPLCPGCGGGLPAVQY